MVNNVFNKMPEGQVYSYPGTSGTPYNNAFYSIYGRAVYAQMKYDFGKYSPRQPRFRAPLRRGFFLRCETRSDDQSQLLILRVNSLATHDGADRIFYGIRNHLFLPAFLPASHIHARRLIDNPAASTLSLRYFP